MKPKVDQKLCIGCGTCEALCPAVFEVIDGHATVKQDADFKANAQCISDAIEACPVTAIYQKKEEEI